MPNPRPIPDFSKPRRAGWVGIAIGLALAAIWWASLGSSVYTGIHTIGIGIHSGVCILVKFDAPPTPMHGAHWLWPRWNIIWWPEWERNPTNVFLAIPLWPFALLLLTLGGLMLHRSRPTPPHLCKSCHYDRRGIPASSLCPECGSTSNTAETPT